MKTEQKTIASFLGGDINIVYRPDRNDYNTLISIINEDEYGVNRMNIQPGDFYIDVGANVGAFGVLCRSSGASGVSVEILPENVEMIKRNFDANFSEWQMSILDSAIAAESGRTVEAYYTPADTESGKHHEFMGTTVAKTSGRRVTVQTISLNDIVQAAGVPVKVLKIDCEGAEWDAFAGASKDTLSKIEFIVGEYHAVGRRWGMSDVHEVTRHLFEDVSKEFGMATATNHSGNFALRRK